MALPQITVRSLGTLERMVEGFGASSHRIFCATCSVVSPSKGRTRVSISYSTTPKLKMSVRWSIPARLVATCSGLM